MWRGAREIGASSSELRLSRATPSAACTVATDPKALTPSTRRGPIPTTLEQLTIADEPARWAALGFALEGELVRIGTVLVRLAGKGTGNAITGWSLRGITSEELDGLPTRIATGEQPAPAPAHPNGVLAIDHVVVFSPQLERTIAALEAAGLELRRVREEPTPAGAPRQAFFRLGEVILEVVQAPAQAIERGGGANAPARLWGLALLSGDLERTVEALGEHAGEIRSAVQPGRQIATLRRSAGLALPVALMSPEPARAL